MRDPKPGDLRPDLDPLPLKDGPGKRQRAPLLLLPMRLEYRVVDRASAPKVMQRTEVQAQIAEIRRAFGVLKPDDQKGRDALAAKLATLTRKTKPQPVRLAEADLKTKTEIWLRWYPDNGFAEAGIAPPTAPETEALDAFLAHPYAQDWPKLGDETLVALWAELESVAGPSRAVHLMRSRHREPAHDHEARIGRITGLPEKIHVFASMRGEIEALGHGQGIPANGAQAGAVSYSPGMLGEGSWISEFETAIEQGMGMKLDDPKAVDLALAADWLICVGTGGGDAEELEQLLRDRIANGQLDILGQDTPTNNVPATRAGRPEADSVQARLWDRTQRELQVLQDKGLDSARLAEALGVDQALFEQAPGAGEGAHLDAAAMIRVIGPALMDGALEATNQLDAVEDTEFVELLARHVQARGLLPALRIGKQAFGILPVSADTGAQVIKPDLPEAEHAFDTFVQSYSDRVRPILTAVSESVSLRLEPDDPDASDKLVDILQTTRVSRRLDVSDEGDDDVAMLGCSYVEGGDEAHKPASYLLEMLRRKLRELPVADEADRAWPLLYRLARLSLSRNRELEVLKGTPGFMTRGKLRRIQGNWRNDLSTGQRRAVDQSRNHSVRSFSTSPLGRIPSARRALVRATNQRFEDALTRLRAVAARDDGTAQLETLMMEVIDLFQHRLDAWITGQASIRLDHLRHKQGVGGLELGYFGFLGRLRRASATGASDGYIQAPSQGQAVSAAILRSAYLRNRGAGAFRIDLSSARTGRALRIMDHIRHGVPLPETLGLRGERWLRDKGASAEIFRLRDSHPLENPDADGKGGRRPVGARCFDGLKLVEGGTRGLSADARALRAVLADDLDALSDLVVAEAVHHRAGGSAQTAAAWLRVLSGGPIPHRPDFLRTRRSGHASDYRVSVVLPQVAPAEEGSLLRLTEYGLAAWFDAALPGLAGRAVPVAIRLGDELLYEAEISLDKQMGLDAMGIAQLGAAGLNRRIGAFAVSDLHATAEMRAMQARDLHLDRTGLEAAGAQITVDLAALSDDLDRAARMWKLAHAAQALSPGDLSNAASPAHPLDEPAHVAALHGAAGELWQRSERVLARLDAHRKSYLTALKRVFRTIATQYEDPGAHWGEDRRRDQRLRLQVAKLHAEMRGLQPFGIDGMDRFPAASRLVATMVDSEAALRKADAVMVARIAALKQAQRGRIASPATLAEARADLTAVLSALRAACGLEKLAICPVFAKSPPLVPLLDPALAPEAALGPWPRYRAKLARLQKVLTADHQGFAVSPDATADDTDPETADLRDEETAPRAYHRGLFLARDADMRAGSVSGLVIDEWVETRPATDQQAAIALNYDSPQAEAPNCLILCVPDDIISPVWTAAQAAGNVREALDLMRLRALSSQTTPLRDTILPLSNLVAHVGSGANERPRIPVAPFKGGLMDWFAVAGGMKRVRDDILPKPGEDWLQTRPIRPILRRTDP